MKIRARANGNILDVSDDAARALIEAGIYESADEASKPKQRAPADVPAKPKKVK